MDGENDVLTCSDSCWYKCSHGIDSSVTNGEMEWLSMQTSSCGTPYSTPYGSPRFSRGSSSSSYASCFSSFGGSLMDTDSEEDTELLDTGQLHPDIFVSDEFMEQGEENLVKEEECEPSHTTVFSGGANIPIPADQNILSSQTQLETDQDATKESCDAGNVILDTNLSSEPDRDTLTNDQLTGTQYGEEVTSLPMPGGEIVPLNEQVMDQVDSNKENTIVYNNILNAESGMKADADSENGIDCLYPLVLPSFETDPLIWLPPDPANKEDDVDTLANPDDDSDNDTKWGQSSLNLSFDEEGSNNSREDQLQKAMSEVMNGQFKILVSRFLAAEGFSLSDGATDNIWLDIVASLSWRAALLVKPDANMGNAMDPGLYVKVKCIASGSCQQSEVINGLVFKKTAAHKQMRANIKHPKLLILKGDIGQFSTGLSSMNSMKQESEQLEKSLSDMIGKCRPDVILVEKAVSRNVNEYVQKQGVTLILLKGSTSETLKKIKRVLHFTVFAAYHLILETSFFTDQRSFITEKNASRKEDCLKIDSQLHFPGSTCDEQYANMEELADTKNSMSQHLHDSEIKNSRDSNSQCIQSNSSRPDPDPSTDIIGDISYISSAESTSGDGFDGSNIAAAPEKLSAHKKEASGKKFKETFDDETHTGTSTSLNPQTILISMSSQNIRNKAVCEQSHLSRITYYGNCDTSLGMHLQDTLLNEKHNCLSCGEPPEAHMYSYTHHDGTLTVLVKSLRLEEALSGEGQRRIWMWTRLGSKVAVFRYSSIEIYSATKPPMTLQFHNPNRKDWLDVEVKSVLAEWKLLFSEIENTIQGLKSRYSGEAMGKNTNSSAYEGIFLEVSSMLAQERNVLEVSLKAFDHIARPETCAHEILSLNWLYQQLLLGFYVWDVRLYHLLQYIKLDGASSDNSNHKSIPENELSSKNISVPIHGDTLSVLNIGVERLEATINSSDDFDNSRGGIISEKDQLTEKSPIKELGSSPGEVDENGSHQNVLPVKNDEHPAPARSNEIYPIAMPSKHLPVLQNLLDFMSDDTREWVWNKLSHLEMGYKKEIETGDLNKFHLINKYTPTSSSLTQLKCQMNLMHFVAGPCGNILSIVEEEISSIIAYALAISEEQGIYSEAAFEKDELLSRRKLDKVAPSNLARGTSMPSSVISSKESLEKDHSLLNNTSSLSYEESTSGFYDSFLSALKDMHPEICLNSEKLGLKSKYTVVSVYARQFYELRKICCPSELVYISSISRCKLWNAQGGKSNAFFAKSMDDRFIIKEIKKTEFDSFLKYGLEYFKHFSESQVSSNPTCLAKILGIYQVKEIRNGKEARTSFMIMENLLFGRNILRRYDLKGALFSRYVADSTNPESVLLDQNFIEDMRTMPIYIKGKNKNFMERALWNDTSFLCNMNVMDYSLFVGVDKQKKELVFGIIDYLRQYTWDKQLESWVKTSLVVPKNLSPTVISPKEYKLRFRAFMSQYFKSVPDG
uniref:1-phosphatidylinositol-3-phosphate 5-kinase n=1 Tax=Aegilops tauschii TaxID=37682 RepID=R7W218_AEGTA